MNKKWKYCSIFLLITALLLLSTGMVSASDIDNSNTEITDNIITDTVSDNTNSISQTDNNIQSKTIQKEVKEKTDTNTTTTSNKELNKDEKNIKTALTAGTLTATPNSGFPGDTIELHLSTTSATSLSNGLTFTVTAKLNNTTFFTTSQRPSVARNAYINVTVPDFEAGTYTLYLEYNFSNGNRGCTGTTEFTILYLAEDTQFSNVGIVNGEIGNTLIPITVTDTDGNALQSDSTLTFKDGQTVLLDNVPITNGVATVAVPTNRLGQYPITVLFNGNEYYNPSTTDIDVNVLQANTILTVNEDDEGFYNAINTIYNTLATGKLTTTSNVAIPEAEITININGTDYTITTDDEGNFEYKYPATSLAESVPITISYTGNDLYSTSNVVTGMFDVEAIELIITLDEVTLSEVNETTTISGTLTDTNNQAITNQDINLTITGINTPITVTTDSEGKFTYDHTFTQAQEVTVTASKDPSNGLYEIQDTTTEFTTVIGPKRTNLIIETGNGDGTNINIVNITPYFNEVITNGTLLDIFEEPVAGATIKILINGENYSQTTDNDGKFSLIYNATEGQTTYTLNVEFEGNDAYKPAEEVYTGTFTTEAFDITVTLDNNLPNEILIGDTITLSGSATLQNNTLKNNPIILTIDGQNYNTNTNENGEFTYDYTVTRSGIIPVIANATFTNSNVNVARMNINVDKPRVNINLDEIENKLIFEDITLNGSIYIASNNTPIEDSLLLTINNQNIDIPTNSEGHFTYTFTPQQIGTYEISITYQNIRYDAQNVNVIVNVVKRETQIIQDKTPVAVKVNDIFTISGHLMDQTSTPVTNKEVLFIIDGQEYTNTTDSEGYYSYNYQTTTVRDDIQYEIRYSGDENYKLAKNYAGSFFDVEAKDTKLSLNYDNIGILTNITGLLTYDDTPLANAEITLFIDDNQENPITLTTNENGAFNYEYVAEKIGTHTATAQYTQNDETITKTIEFTVNKANTIIEVPDINATIGKVISLTAQVKDEANNPVNGGKAVFKINGVTLKDTNGKVIYTTVQNGTATINEYTVPASWENGVNITVTYSGTTLYQSSHSEAKTIVANKEMPTLILTPESITATINQTVTITATVKDTNNNNINNGKIVLKLNGKTIKDNTGKVVYLTVENGTASYDYTIPENLKCKTYNITALYTSPNYQRLENTIELTVTPETTQNNTNTTGIDNSNKTTKTDSPTTHIINDANVDDYITASGLSDLVSSGDTLDIQGVIDRQHSLVINKPVNIISSTQDAYISLHSVSKDYFGSDPGNCFVVNTAASGSNISNLYLYNTECWLFNTYDVTLYNMTMFVSNQSVGNGVGQTAIRYCERITIDSCYIFTENNGGSTSLAFTGSSDIFVRNTTIQGQGNVGNLIYPGNAYNSEDKPSSFTVRNTNLSFIECTVIGTCTAAINVAVYNNANNCSFINNSFYVTGNYGYLDTGANGVAIGNKMYNTSQIIVRQNCTATENVFYGTGKLTPYTGANVYNNTIYLLDNYYQANIYNNTITTVTMHNNTALSNNTITGNINIQSSTSERVSYVNITDNTIYGSIVATGTATRRISDINIIDNNITGGISLTQTTNAHIEGNSINGTITVTSSASGTQITNNTIVTANQYAIANSATTSTISDNYMISDNYNKLGADAISGNKNQITGNGPDASEFWYIVIEDIYTTIGDYTPILVSVIDEINGNVEGGEIYLMINDDILTDEEGNIIKITVHGSQALFDVTVADEWLRSDAVLTAVYTNGNISKTNSTRMQINKKDATVNILTETLTITQGETITLQAQVSFENEPVTGQLAFKLNGKSLKDENNELIYVDVIDGIATLEYTFDDNFDADSYTLTAVFKNDLYNRATDTKTLVIE